MSDSEARVHRRRSAGPVLLTCGALLNLALLWTAWARRVEVLGCCYAVRALAGDRGTNAALQKLRELGPRAVPGCGLGYRLSRSKEGKQAFAMALADAGSIENLYAFVHEVDFDYDAESVLLGVLVEKLESVTSVEDLPGLWIIDPVAEGYPGWEPKASQYHEWGESHLVTYGWGCYAIRVNRNWEWFGRHPTIERPVDRLERWLPSGYSFEISRGDPDDPDAIFVPRHSRIGPGIPRNY
jgi:hypothetical protein